MLGALFILSLFAGYTVYALYELPGAGPPVAVLFSFLPERSPCPLVSSGWAAGTRSNPTHLLSAARQFAPSVPGGRCLGLR